MKAAVVGENGLDIKDIAEPKPAPNEVLIRVRACGLNRADAMVASGMAHGRAGGAGPARFQLFLGGPEGVPGERQKDEQVIE